MSAENEVWTHSRRAFLIEFKDHLKLTIETLELWLIRRDSLESTSKSSLALPSEWRAQTKYYCNLNQLYIANELNIQSRKLLMLTRRDNNLKKIIQHLSAILYSSFIYVCICTYCSPIESVVEECIHRLDLPGETHLGVQRRHRQRVGDTHAPATLFKYFIYYLKL